MAHSQQKARTEMNFRLELMRKSANMKRSNTWIAIDLTIAEKREKEKERQKGRRGEEEEGEIKKTQRMWDQQTANWGWEEREARKNGLAPIKHGSRAGWGASSGEAQVRWENRRVEHASLISSSDSLSQQYQQTRRWILWQWARDRYEDWMQWKLRNWGTKRLASFLLLSSLAARMNCLLSQ